MTPSSLQKSIEFMMLCRRGFDPDAALGDLKKQVLTQVQESVNVLAETILAQQETADAGLDRQLERLCVMDPFGESCAVLEEMSGVLLQNKEDQEMQGEAIVVAEKTVLASKVAYATLEANLKKHLEAVCRNSVSADAQIIFQLGNSWCKKVTRNF